MNAREWQKLSASFRRKLRILLTRGVVHLIDPDTLMQTLQVELLRGEVLDDIEHWEGYGRTARAPIDGAEVLAAAVGADRAHTVAIAVANRRFRVRNLAPGEQAIYDDIGNIIFFKRDRILIDSVDLVEVRAPLCRIDAATTQITGDLQVDGGIEAGGEIHSDTGFSEGA